jgi:N-acetylneuraminate synthase
MFSKYKSKKEFKKNEPLFKSNFKLNDSFAKQMDKRFYIKEKILEKLNNVNLVIPKKCKIELSHHFGIKKFFETGAVLFHIVNNEKYSKIIIMMFAGQSYPSHYHIKKNETYFVLSGDLNIKVGNKKKNLKTGDTFTILNQELHSFSTKNGVIFEEIATSYIKGDSKYIKKDKMQIKRKTIITLH